MQEPFVWKTDLTTKAWDEAVILLNGHPLQTAAWGTAKKNCHQIKDHYWIAYQKEQPIFLARFEERRFAGLLKIAWVPKGPVCVNPLLQSRATHEFLMRLKERKFLGCILFPWKNIKPKIAEHLPQTIWLDLRLGKETLWQQAHQKFRYGVKQAKEHGVSIHISQKSDDLLAFYALCKRLSKKKKFTFNVSSEFLAMLLDKHPSAAFECCLFLAHTAQTICGGAFIIRCGKNIHYFWGAVDREQSTNRMQVGDALQWAIIEWALEKNCTRYDLEGIDRKHNPGVYRFKSKLKGQIITMPGLEIFPLGSFSTFIFKCIHASKWLHFIAPSLSRGLQLGTLMKIPSL